MANPCSPHLSEPKPGIGPVILYDVAQLANFLASEGMGWLSEFAPQVAAKSYDLPSFCAADPPPTPTNDAATILNFFSPLNPTGAADLKAWLIQVADYFLWYADCQCSASPQPTPPTPIPQPTGLNTQPPGTGTPVGNSCYSNNPFFDIPDDGVLYTQNSIPRPAMPAGATAIQVDWSLASGSLGEFPVTLNWYPEVNDVANPAVDNHSFTVNTNTSGSYIFALPIGTTGWNLNYQTTELTDGTSAALIHEFVFCGGSLPNSPSPCCPPDTATQGILNEILALLNQIYSIIPVRVPNYAAGVPHTGLTGQGTLALAATTIAIQVTVTTLPVSYGEVFGSPNTYIDVGWITPVNNEGPTAGIRISRAIETFALPEATSSIDYSLPPGEIISVAELQAG